VVVDVRFGVGGGGGGFDVGILTCGDQRRRGA
jgi:hypothetical protein